MDSKKDKQRGCLLSASCLPEECPWCTVLLSCYMEILIVWPLNLNQIAYFALSYFHSGEELTNTVSTSIWINHISHVISAPVFNISQLVMDLVFPHWSRAHEYVLFPTVGEALGSHSFFLVSFLPTDAEGPQSKAYMSNECSQGFGPDYLWGPFVCLDRSWLLWARGANV